MNKVVVTIYQTIKYKFFNKIHSFTFVIFDMIFIKMFFAYIFVSDQRVLIGAEEGLYTLNLNEIHENTMELVSAN